MSILTRPFTGMGTGDDAESLLRVLLKTSCTISLAHNPWERPPAAVVAAGKTSIRGYYDELKGRDPVEMQSLKVVLAGHSGAGKTRYALRGCTFFPRSGKTDPHWPAIWR